MINTKYSSLKDWLMLLAAVVITVLFIVFAEPILTSLYLGSDTFADAMYDYNLYFILTLCVSIVVWVVAILYYWIIDYIGLSSFVWWSVFCLLAIIVAAGTAYFYPLNIFETDNLEELITQLPVQALITIPLSLVLYVIVSIGIKGMSKNCSTRPF